MKQREDAELVRLALKDDPQAFSQLIDRYKGAVYGIALSMMGDFDAAEDVAQESFLKAYLHLRRLDAPTRFGNWLRIIAANQARTHLRRRSAPVIEPSEEMPVHTLSAEQQAARREGEERKRLLEIAALEALKNLPEKNRQALILHYLGGRTTKQVAAFLGISGPAVKMQLHRARRHLQQEAEKMVEETLNQKRLGSEFADRFQLLELTVLYADLSGFAAKTRDMDAVEVAQLLFDYHGEMGDLVLQHGGTLDRYDGSAFTAFFGAPMACEDHAGRACRAALAMGEKLAAWPEQGKPEIGLRCGLSSGRVLVGDMGSRHRADYTVAGDAVHLAARLQKLAHSFNITVAVDEEVREQVKDELVTRRLDHVTLPESEQSDMAYEILGRRGELTDEQEQIAALFHKGMEQFEQKQWREALAFFEEINRENRQPRDWLSARYRDRCWMRLEVSPFAELAHLPEDNMKMLLRHVDQRDLLEAFRETDPEVRAGFTRVMSRRVRRYFAEAFEQVAQTGYSREEIAGKQRKIVAIAGWLAREGKISPMLDSEPIDRQAVLARIRNQLALDCNCRESNWTEDGLSLVTARELPGRRLFPRPEKTLTLMTMGRGIVVTCDPERMAWIEENLKDLERDQLFTTETLARLQELVALDDQFIAGPDLKFTCSKDQLRPVPYTNGLQLELHVRETIDRLYKHTGFPNALGYDPKASRPDVLACTGSKDGQVIAIAAASADSDDLWQIGVDVLPPFRGKGIACELVYELTRSIFARGKLPYYSTRVDNLASSNVVLRLGYWLAWIEVYARDRPRA